MKKTRLLLAATGLIAAAIISINLTGCEDDESVSSADDVLGNFNSLNRENVSLSTLRISPESATITFAGQKVTFTVDDGKGGFDWDVADTGAGKIEVTGNDGRTAVYTATQRTENDVVVVDGEGNAAVATLDTQTSALGIVPSSFEVESTIGKEKHPVAVGGQPPYSWSVLDQDLATITATGTSPTYTVQSADAGTNTVVLTDEKGSYITATVIHKP